MLAELEKEWFCSKCLVCTSSEPLKGGLWETRLAVLVVMVTLAKHVMHNFFYYSGGCYPWLKRVASHTMKWFSYRFKVSSEQWSSLHYRHLTCRWHALFTSGIHVTKNTGYVIVVNSSIFSRWSSDGIRTEVVNSSVLCQPTHLTSFAVLVQVTSPVSWKATVPFQGKIWEACDFVHVSDHWYIQGASTVFTL